MEAKEEALKALRSLPWYLVGGYLFGPLILAIFTGGAALAIYLMPVFFFDSSGKVPIWLALLLMCAPGLAAWTFRQFFRAAAFSWKRSHLVAH